jgi:ABC-type transport system substrate-binding protein
LYRLVAPRAGTRRGRYLTSVKPADLAHLQSVPGVTVASTPAIRSGARSCLTLLMLNVTKPWLDDKQVRQLLACAGDRQLILD